MDEHTSSLLKSVAAITGIITIGVFVFVKTNNHLPEPLPKTERHPCINIAIGDYEVICLQEEAARLFICEDGVKDGILVTKCETPNTTYLLYLEGAIEAPAVIRGRSRFYRQNLFFTH